MANLPPDPNSGPNTPRWVKAFGVIGIVLVLLILIMTLAGGNHGPGRHMPLTNSETLPASVTQHRLKQL